jgi:hypothetical protein
MDDERYDKILACKAIMERTKKQANYDGISVLGGMGRIALFGIPVIVMYVLLFGNLARTNSLLFLFIYVFVCMLLIPFGLLWLESSSRRKQREAYHKAKLELQELERAEIKERSSQLLEYSAALSDLVKTFAAEARKNADERQWEALREQCRLFAVKWAGKGVDELKPYEILTKYIEES